MGMISVVNDGQNQLHGGGTESSFQQCKVFWKCLKRHCHDCRSIMIRDRGGAHCEQFLQKSLLLSFVIRFKYILSEPVLTGLLTKSQKSFPLITVN